MRDKDLLQRSVEQKGVKCFALELGLQLGLLTLRVLQERLGILKLKTRWPTKAEGKSNRSRRRRRWKEPDVIAADKRCRVQRGRPQEAVFHRLQSTELALSPRRVVEGSGGAW